jgi:putative tryptophan/tyrosine transport system substrate-binding protein
MSGMKRRKFITLLGGAAAAWPLAARAQQPTMPVVGYLNSTSPDTYPAEHVRALRQGLKDAGYLRGRERNDRISLGGESNRPAFSAGWRAGSSAGRSDRGSRGPAAAFAAKATATIPIVFAVPEDPVRLGLVTSLARPGGNLTGVNFFAAEVAAKRLELLRELVPAAARVAVLLNPAEAAIAAANLRDVEIAARAMGLQIQVHNASSNSEIDAAFASIVRERPDALFISSGPFFTSRRVQLAHLATRHALPAIMGARHTPKSEG